MKPKYKIGDVIIWDISVMAQITELKEDLYRYRFISHYDKRCINQIGSNNISKLEYYTKLLTDEEKLKLL